MFAHYTHISFLDDIARIAVRNYEPSDDDVVRARLRTLGVLVLVIAALAEAWTIATVQIGIPHDNTPVTMVCRPTLLRAAR